MTKVVDFFKSLLFLILAGLVVWNVYSGLTLRRLEIPGLVSVEFGDGEESSPGNNRSEGSNEPVPGDSDGVGVRDDRDACPTRGDEGYGPSRDIESPRRP